MWHLAIPAIAAALGAVSSGASSALAKPGGFKNIDTKTPQQKQAMDWALQQGQQQIQNPLQNIQGISQGLTNQWNQQVVPSLAARFSGLGDNKLSSTGFTNQLRSSGNELNDMLGRFGLQSQAQGQNLFNQGLGDQFQPTYQGPEHTFWSGLLGGAGSALSQFGGSALGMQGGGGGGGGQQGGGGFQQLIQSLSPEKKQQALPILQQLMQIFRS